MADYVAARIKDDTPPEFSGFLSPNTIFVPIPRSSLQKSDALWPALAFADALVAKGLGKQVVTCLRRTKAIAKAATAPQGNRPPISDHLESLEFDFSLVPSGTIVLLDDIVTRGTQFLGAAQVIWRSLPQLDLRAFAIMRTISLESNFKTILAPVAGRISAQGNYGNRVP